MKNIVSVLALILTVSAVAVSYGADKLVTRVEVRDGVPVLLVNGDEVVPDFIYHTLGSSSNLGYVFPNVLGKEFNPSEELVKLAQKHGFHLYTFPIPLIFPRNGAEPDYSALDKMFKRHLELDPDALFLLRLRGDTPSWWLKENPEELQGYLFSQESEPLSKSAERELSKFPSAASQKWQEAYYDALRRQVEYIEKHYGNHVLGYHPGSQSANENFYPRSWERKNITVAGADENFRKGFAEFAKEKYGTVDRMNRAWRTSFRDFDAIALPTFVERIAGDLGTFRNPETQRYVIDFSDYMQRPITETTIGSARVIKEVTDGEKIVVVFFSSPQAGHTPLNAVQRGGLGFQEILESPYIDVIVNPYDYRTRQHGGVGAIGNMTDSIIANGKMYFVEDDTRNHRFPYNHFGKTTTLEESLDVYTRIFPKILQYGHGHWYMCFGSGANADEDLFGLFEKLREIRENFDIKPFRPEVAVVFDTESYYYLRGSNEVSLHAFDMLADYAKMGTPFARYTLADVITGNVSEEIKVLFFINAFVVNDSQRKQLHNVLKDGARTAVWFYAPGYIDENRADIRNITELTGIEVEEIKRPASARYRMARDFMELKSGHAFGVRSTLDTLFAIKKNQFGVTCFAEYADSNLCGLAAKEMNGWNSVLFTGVRFGPEMFREISRAAGAHIYNDSNDSISASSNFVAITALSNGDKTLRLPEKSDLVNLLTNEEVARNVDVVTLPMRTGETLLFGVQSNTAH